MAPAFQALVQGRKYHVFGPEIRSPGKDCIGKDIQPADPEPIIELPDGRLWRCYGRWWPKDDPLPHPGHIAWWRPGEEPLLQRIFKAVPVE